MTLVLALTLKRALTWTLKLRLAIIWQSRKKFTSTYSTQAALDPRTGLKKCQQFYLKATINCAKMKTGTSWDVAAKF